ncbi:hypothetical protein DENSPDRAFT_838916 [Dentipellis sp. KUC8613]|nr:hypothetical protein DENSPDRAFT_838916 [Dentipellis sp. KUC8613]
MSNDIQKADQIVHRAYYKLALLVHNARATTPSTSNKPDKWFNLETPDADLYRDVLRPYRAVSAGPPPPFTLQVLLSVPALNANQVLVYRPDNSASRLRVEPTPRLILLESWSLLFAPHEPADPSTDLPPSTIYKYGIGMFRSIYTLLCVLPAWKLANRLRRRNNGAFTIVLRVAGAEPEEGLLGFDVSPSPAHAPLETTTLSLPPLPHPHGDLTLHVKHLVAPQFFALDELESVLSSRLLSLDDDRDGEDVPFTPTLVKNQARESLRSATSTSASPRQGPSAALTAARTRTYSTHTSTSPHLTASNRSPGSRAVPLPTTMTSRQLSDASAISAASSHSHTRSREESVGVVTGIGAGFVGARARKESSSSLRGADLPSSPVPLPSSSPTTGAGPLPIRRPALALNPFKSSTLSTSSSPSPSLQSPSLSLRQTSPLALAGRQIPVPTPTPSRVPPSPIGGGMALGSVGSKMSSSPAAGAGGTSLSSAEGAGRGVKRYSSSFGHRYKDSGGGGSDVSGSGSAAGVSGSAERERKDVGGGGGGASVSPFRQALPLTGTSQGSQGTSFPSMGPVTRPTADEEDLSAFMQDISQRKPLGGRHLRTQSDSTSPAGQAHDRDLPASSSPSSRNSVPFGHMRGGTTPEYPPALDRESGGEGSPGRTGQVLTSQEAIGEELQRMNAAFAATLEMLGGARRRERTQSSPSPSPSPGSASGSGARPRPYRESSLSRGMRELDSPRRRAERISEVTEASTESGNASPMRETRGLGLGAERESGEAIGLGLVLGPRPGSRADSIASDQVIGKLELDDDRRRSMGR